MKKFLSLLCVAVLLVTCLPTARAAADISYVSRASAVESALLTLGVSSSSTLSFDSFDECYTGDKQGNYAINESEEWERGMPLLCMVNAAVPWCGFDDVDKGDFNPGCHVSLAKKMGIVDGYNAHTFKPNQNITWNEAVKLLVCAFGFKNSVEGTYPEGYLRRAEALGVLKGRTFDGGKPIPETDFTALLRAFASLETLPEPTNSYLTFVRPDTNKELFNRYAEAVRNRHGATQFGLLSAPLRKANRAQFAELNWVTGVSSPWVTGYDIQETADGANITFHYATSAGPAPDLIVKIKASGTILAIDPLFF